jgi:hypothetical protein
MTPHKDHKVSGFLAKSLILAGRRKENPYGRPYVPYVLRYLWGFTPPHGRGKRARQ